jgi:predicted benzoate:H+ symporter BenE
MSSITQLFAYETLPSLLTVVGASSIVIGLMTNTICNADDTNCQSNVNNVKVAGIISAVAGLVLGLLAMLGVLSFGSGYGFGGYGGGYGGYGW